MTITSAASFVDSLREHNLLEPLVLDELRVAMTELPDARTMARQLLEAGLLTPFQVNQLFLGRGQDLVLGQYLILERLGEGGMGQVFKARHQGLDRTVALKVIRKDLLAKEETVRRFRREIQAIAQLSHPNIILAYDADEVNGMHYYVMEYVDGTNLKELVKHSGPLPLGQACDYIHQVALGLQHAAERGLVHRDIKPSNLLVTWTHQARSQPSRWGSHAPLVKILDMGLARLQLPFEEGEVSHTLTRAGIIMGTPDYIAPEQAQNPHAADIRSDLYSLGCTFYYFLTGEVPFPGGTAVDKMFRHRLDDPPPVEQLRRNVPIELARIVRRLMGKFPEDRYQTPKELARALAPFLNIDESDLSSVAEVPVLAPEQAGVGPASRAGLARSAARLAAPTSLARPFLSARQQRWLVLAGAPASVLLFGFLLYLLISHLPHAGDKKGPEEAGLTPPTPEPPPSGFLELQGRFHKLQSDAEAVRQGLLGYRRSHPGTPQSREVIDYLQQLHSPLDRLDAQGIPAAERMAGQPSELVAVLGEHRLRHWGPVQALVYNGSLLVSGGADHAIRIWDPATGKERALLKEHAAEILDLDLLPGGQTLVSASADNTLKLWDLAGLKETLSARLTMKHVSRVTAVALAPGGKLLASGSQLGNVRLWEVRTGKELTALKGHRAAVRAVAFAPDGKTLASASEDGTVKLWNVASHKELGTFLKHQGPVYALAFAPDGKTIASGSEDRSVRLWDPVKLDEIQSPLAHASAIHGLAFAPAGGPLASACANGNIKLWDTETGEELHRLPGHWGMVYRVAFAADGQTLASVGRDGSVKLWDAASGRERLPARGHRGAVRSVAITADGKTVVSLGEDGGVKLWDAATGKERRRLQGLAGTVGCLALSPDSQSLATGSRDGAVHLWDLDTLASRRTLLYRGAIHSLAFAPDGHKLAAGCEDSTIKIWDPDSGKPLASLRGHADCHALAFSADGSLLGGTAAHFDKQGEMTLWDAATGKEWATIGEHTGAGLAFSPDHRALVSGSLHGTLRFWDLAGNRPRPGVDITVHLAVQALAFHPAGKVLFLAGDNGHIVQWNLPGRRTIGEWQLPGPVHDLSFASDSRHLATANGNGTVYIFRLSPPPAKANR